jgi:hypothetical protein
MAYVYCGFRKTILTANVLPEVMSISNKSNDWVTLCKIIPKVSHLLPLLKDKSVHWWKHKIQRLYYVGFIGA